MSLCMQYTSVRPTKVNTIIMTRIDMYFNLPIIIKVPIMPA